MKRFILLLALLLCSAECTASRPNFVVVLCDDLGYGDLTCYGNASVHTPHLDRFAAESLKFTDCYSAAPNCSPSRAGLMTGRTPWRVGIHNWIPMMSPVHVRESEVTIASLLRADGYSTAHCGKWHLNGMFNLPGQPQPDDHGFDHWFSTQNNCLPNHQKPWNFVRNGNPVGEVPGFAADIVTEEAVQWLRNEDGSGRDLTEPFFLFVCYHEPHEPIATAERFTRLYDDREDLSERALLGNITQMDAAFGRLMAELDSLQLRENTVVFFTSDNGPAITGRHPYGSAGPLRAKKGHIWDGGIRVPGMLRWPGRATSGSVSSEPVCGVDLLPTVCDIAGIDAPADRPLDGTSWLPLLNDPAGSLQRATPLYWHFARARSDVKVAIRDGDWKLVARLDQPIPDRGADIEASEMEMYRLAELVDFELYDVRNDVAESSDQKEQHPRRFEQMKLDLIQKYHEVRDESPTWPEWTWPRYEGQRIQWPDYRPLRKPPVYPR